MQAGRAAKLKPGTTGAYGAVMARKLLLFVAVSLPWVALAGDPPPRLKGTKTERAPRLDLGVPKFGELPKDQPLQTAAPDEKQTAPSGSRVDESYTVVRVVHGKSFTRGPDGARPAAPFTVVTASGDPLVTERFSTVVRVKNPAKKNTRIEVAILDPRTDTVMEAQGELRFPNGPEAEWQVDWDPTTLRVVGEFQVLVRVGGNPLGTTPLKVVVGPK